jgi:serine/threonine-protein kinase
MVGTEVGDYRVLELLGAGGMGEVYRGVHTRLGRVVALKVLSPAMAVSASSERFRNEARIHAGLRHPHIATLFEYVECEGRSCMVMEYVSGETLSALLERQGALPPSQAIQYLYELAQAVSYLHDHDIVHRDIKSSNVKIDTQGQAKLLDFGIARSASSPRLTQVGSIVGTLEYMAPEQLCGEPATPQSDIWALGVLLYESLTGQMPFAANDLPSLHHKITRVGYTRASLQNPQVTNAIDNVIARCLQKSPSARYADAKALAHDLQALISQSPTSQSSPAQQEVRHASSEQLQNSNAATHYAPAGSRNRVALLVGGAAALVLLIAVCGAILFGGRATLTATSSPATSSLTEKDSRESRAEESTLTGAQREVKIDVTVGQAEIYRDNELIGTTPYVLNERLGTDVNLTLKQPGYRDKPVRFTITERKRSYSFLMEKE